MPSFAFWNVNRKDLDALVAELVRELSVDVLVLAEHQTAIGSLLEQLNRVSETPFFYAPSIEETRLRVFVRYTSSFVQPFFDGEHITVRRLVFPGLPEILLAAVHLPSPMHFSEADRSKKAAEVIQIIDEREQTAGHGRTIVVGDFNMNPFSDGLTSANAFHAVGVRSVARKNTRVVSGKRYRMFFNPMWEHFSDGEDRPAGTFFFPPKGYDSTHWHMFDQLLVRPEIMEWLKRECLSIVERVGESKLVDEGGRPSVSDHLPLCFQLSPT